MKTREKKKFQGVFHEDDGQLYRIVLAAFTVLKVFQGINQLSKNVKSWSPITDLSNDRLTIPLPHNHLRDI